MIPQFVLASMFCNIYNYLMIRLFLLSLIFSMSSYSASIAIIDTGFDLDHHFLKQKLVLNETENDVIDFQGLDFFDNSHLKKAVIEDENILQEILLFRNLRAKGHKQGLEKEEFDWYNKKNADKDFMSKVSRFKKHSHGTFVAGIALREGENINILPIRGLNHPAATPIVKIEDNSDEAAEPLRSKLPEEQFKEELNNSLGRVSKKFAKICAYIAKKKIEIVNASYGITAKSLVPKFRERYRDLTGTDISEQLLNNYMDEYFEELYLRGARTMRRYPNILFVFSAGNSGHNNDEIHHYPSRIKIPNAISVAAMNGEYIASFSNYGFEKVDIGAPGVAILSLVPKVYSHDGNDIYSPSSGTSMAAPHISNLAAQILNMNPKLKAHEIKQIILETGDVRPHLKKRLASGAIANTHKALKTALLSKDMELNEAIALGRLDIVPIEDQISIGLPKETPEAFKRRVLESFPSTLMPKDIDDEATEDSTKPSSSQPVDRVKAPLGKTKRPPSTTLIEPEKSSNQDPANQNEEQSLIPSEETPASSSEPELTQAPDQSPAPSPSLRQ